MNSEQDNTLSISQFARLIDFIDIKSTAAVASPLYNKAYRQRKTGVSNNNLASAMSRFPDPVREIAEMDHSDAVDQASEHAFEIKGWWFNEESVSCEPDGCSDYDPDLNARMITDVIRMRKDAGHCWGWKAELDRFGAEAEVREEMGAEKWFSKTRQALKELVNELGAGKEGALVAQMVVPASVLDPDSDSDDGY